MSKGIREWDACLTRDVNQNKSYYVSHTAQRGNQYSKKNWPVPNWALQNLNALQVPSTEIPKAGKRVYANTRLLWCVLVTGFIRTVFVWVSKLICICFTTLWLVEKKSRHFSTTKQKCYPRTRFPALALVTVYLLQVLINWFWLIGSLFCLLLLWLVIVIAQPRPQGLLLIHNGGRRNPPGQGCWNTPRIVDYFVTWHMMKWLFRRLFPALVALFVFL